MVNLEYIKEKMAELKDWALEGNSIVKDFMFANFKEAMDFVNKTAEISEKHNHHPLVIIDYNRVRLQLTTYERNELTEKDFAVAEEVDLMN